LADAFNYPITNEIFLIRILKKIWKLLKETAGKFMDDNPMNYSAAIAFYTIFSLPGILIVTVYFVGLFYDRELVQSEIFYQIRMLIGEKSASEIENILANAEESGEGAIARTVGVITLLFSATTVFISLQQALNRIWRLKAKPERGWLKFILNRLLSFGMIISVGFLLLVSLVVDALLVIFKDYMAGNFAGLSNFLLAAFNFLFSLGLITLVFGLIFKVLPDAKIKWKDVGIGAFITTLLFIVGKYLISFYLASSSLGSTYGAAGSLVLLLIWIYYSSTIMLLGAEFTFIYSRNIGSIIMPSPGAVKVKLKEQEEGDNATVND
jgi:membrane protein